MDNDNLRLYLYREVHYSSEHPELWDFVEEDFDEHKKDIELEVLFNLL